VVLQALKMFLKGVHHIAVFDKIMDGEVVGVLTSINLLRVILDHSDVLGRITETQVGQLFATGSGVVLSAPLSQSTRVCFQTLLTHQFLGMPIINSHGAMVANLSLSDIRWASQFTRERLNDLLDGPVAGFIDAISAAHSRTPVLTVRVSDSLTTAMEIMTVNNVHRVYITDAGIAPIGIITITDILQVLSSPTVIAYVPFDPMAASGSVTSPTTPMDLFRVLHGINARTFLQEYGAKDASLVEVDVDAPLSHVLQVMAKHNVHAVAVYKNVIVSEVSDSSVYAGGGGMSGGGEIPDTTREYVGWIDGAGA
jgi:CBS domain-containing protein